MKLCSIFFYYIWLHQSIHYYLTNANGPDDDASQDHDHHGHNCVHDEMIDLFQSTIDLESLIAIQHPDNVECTSTSSGEIKCQMEEDDGNTRRLLESNENQSNYEPIRIAFDISKLVDDPGFVCTKAGEQVRLGASSSIYSCSTDDVLTSSKREMIATIFLQEIEEHFSSTLSVLRTAGSQNYLKVPGRSYFSLYLFRSRIFKHQL